MKTILIVDTPKNCAIAKNLLESNKSPENFYGYYFEYCSNFIEAQEKIFGAQAVIIGLSIPYSNEKLFKVGLDYIGSDRIQIARLSYSETEALEINSYTLLLRANFLGKAAVLLSEINNDLKIIVANFEDDQKAFKSAALISQNFKDQYDPDLLAHSYNPGIDMSKYFKCQNYLELLYQSEETPTPLNLFQFWLYAKMGKTKVDWTIKNSSKQSYEAWKKVFEKTQEQLNYL